MQFLKKLKLLNALKIAGLVILAVIIAALAFRLIGSSINSVLGWRTYGNAFAPSEEPSYDYSYGAEKMDGYGASGEMGLSTRNVATMPPVGQGTSTGDAAENFEVTEYSANIETRQLERTCATVAGLKSRDYVVFENASEYEHGCNYYFKVKRASTDEVLGVIKGLKPKDFSESTFTIKEQVDDFTSETEILKKKLASIDATLEKAVGAYDEVTELATRVKDVESLAKIIDSKINLIERLTQERISVNAELERLERAKAEQLDRIEYTFFNVTVVELKLVDGKELLDSWKDAVRSSVQDVNEIAQDVSVNLISLTPRVLQFALYFLIVLVVVKYGWRVTKRIWKG